MPRYHYIPDPYVPTDRQCLLPLTNCSICRDELYTGEVCYRIEGRLICENCLTAFARVYFAGCRRRLCLPPEDVQ